MKLKKLVSISFSLLLLFLPVLVFIHKQTITDWWFLRSYDPPESILQLATATTMTDESKKIFYVTRPQILQKEAFRASCTSAEKTIVLGCYKAGQGIFIYDVTDDRLKGIEEVTAAHEMLHAAYDRLSSKERQQVDALTNEVYVNLKDERIKKNVDSYRENDASVVPNELHSILGTEVQELPEALENHYKRYFNDRNKLVSLLKQYEVEFSNREKQVALYDQQLASLRSEFDALKESLQQQSAAIDAEFAYMDSLLQQKRYDEYNARIPNYQRLVDKYNKDVETINSKKDEFNALVEKRNAIVIEEQDLFKAIDTRSPSTR